MPADSISSIFSRGAISAVLLTVLMAAVVSLAVTPLVKILSVRMGAVDVPKDGRRMHDHPIPRLGGLAIFLGFLFAVLVAVPLDAAKQGMLIGAVIIVILGIFDDIYTLSAKLKLMVQTVAAVVTVLAGNRIVVLGWLSIPITVLWIVMITNAVNLIDGLDGLACGVSTIGSATMLFIALLVSEPDVALLMGALAGACIGFLPFNFNPAKIFMGDTGATFLGFVMATVSVQGIFKLYSMISFMVPFLMLGLPIFDVCFAVIRRVSRGQSPMRPDRSHIHHKLIDMGLSQKQTVGVLYVISAMLGFTAVVLTTSGALRAVVFLLTMVWTGVVAWRIFISGHTGKGLKDCEVAEEDDRGPSEP